MYRTPDCDYKKPYCKNRKVDQETAAEIRGIFTVLLLTDNLDIAGCDAPALMRAADVLSIASKMVFEALHAKTLEPPAGSA